MTWCDKQYPKEADEHQKNIDQPYGVEMITMITQWIRPPSVDRSAIWFFSCPGQLNNDIVCPLGPTNNHIRGSIKE